MIHIRIKFQAFEDVFDLQIRCNTKRRGDLHKWFLRRRASKGKIGLRWIRPLLVHARSSDKPHRFDVPATIWFKVFLPYVMHYFASKCVRGDVQPGPVSTFSRFQPSMRAADRDTINSSAFRQRIRTLSLIRPQESSGWQRGLSFRTGAPGKNARCVTHRPTMFLIVVQFLATLVASNGKLELIPTIIQMHKHYEIWMEYNNTT